MELMEALQNPERHAKYNLFPATNGELLYYQNKGFMLNMPLVNSIDKIFGIMVLLVRFIKTTRCHQIRLHPMVKKIVLISLMGFFLAVLVVSLHHHDNSFGSPNCSICKLKASLNGSFSKIGVGSFPPGASLHLLVITIFLCLSGNLNDRKTLFIDSQIAVTYPNRAPPFRF